MNLTQKQKKLLSRILIRELYEIHNVLIDAETQIVDHQLPNSKRTSLKLTPKNIAKQQRVVVEKNEDMLALIQCWRVLNL